MSSLYEIDGAIMELIERGFTTDCVTEDGEIDEAKIQAYLQELPVERDKKLEAYGCLIKNLTAEADAIRTEEKALANRRQQKEKTIDRLKESVTASMLAFGEAKKETAKVVFSFRKSVSVEVPDIDKLDHDYIRTKIDYVADKTAIKQAIQNGATVAGAALVEKKQHTNKVIER